jgi:hypothetical protein
VLDRVLLVAAIVLAAILGALIWRAGPIPHDTYPVSITSKEQDP